MSNAAPMRIRRALLVVVVTLACSRDERCRTRTRRVDDHHGGGEPDPAGVDRHGRGPTGHPVLRGRPGARCLPAQERPNEAAGARLVHGGGWNSGDKAEFAPYAMQAATEQQWAVFDVDYLLSATDVSSWPDELHDIQAAIRFIATNAQNFGIDPQKIVALGESAGANLLALISSEGTANPVRGDPVGDNPTLAVPLRAVGLWSPPVDLADLYANGGQPPASCGPDQACDFVWTQGAIAQYMHCDPTSCPEAYTDASPTTWVSSNTAPSVRRQLDQRVGSARPGRAVRDEAAGGARRRAVRATAGRRSTASSTPTRCGARRSASSASS